MLRSWPETDLVGKYLVSLRFGIVFAASPIALMVYDLTRSALDKQNGIFSRQLLLWFISLFRPCVRETQFPKEEAMCLKKFQMLLLFICQKPLLWRYIINFWEEHAVRGEKKLIPYAAYCCHIYRAVAWLADRNDGTSLIIYFSNISINASCNKLLFHQEGVSQDKTLHPILQFYVTEW